MSQTMKKFLSAGWLFAAAALIGAGTTTAQSEPLVRVALLKDAQRIEFNIRGSYQIMDPQSGLPLDKGRRLPRTTARPGHPGIRLDDDQLNLKAIRLIPSKDVSIFVNGADRRYRGELDIVQTGPDQLLVVNRLGLEDYVRGVLYHEVSDRWPMEALKAQALATRSYALYQMENNKAKPFDVTSDIYSQVYGGRSAERYRTNLAVDQTEGEVLTFQGKILPAYFHANSGGYTEDASELWKHDMAPLKGVRSEFSRYSPHYVWKKNFQSSEIQKKLNANGYQLGLIKDIQVLERNRSGRIRKLEIATRDGQTVTIAGKDFRNIIGPNLIRSNNYDVMMKGYYFDLFGKGWGHGVGMCQWGAREMARQHYTYRDILSHYYPQTLVQDYRRQALFRN